MKSEVTIRRGRVEDLPLTADLWNRANAAYGRTLAVEHQGDVARERIAKRITDDDAYLMIAEVDGNLAGMLLGTALREKHGEGPIIAGWANIGWVAVDPAYWGRGIATELMEDLLQRLREKGFAHVQLWTHQDNVRAQRVYERLGFMATGQQMRDSSGALILHYALDL
jgi:ribosomal protein S18 acetylase RimI-like enzyme